MRRKVFALVDCNNFYVSCERVSPRPRARVAASYAAASSRFRRVKSCFKMARRSISATLLDRTTPPSSLNYALYGDMSPALETLEEFTPDIDSIEIRVSDSDYDTTREKLCETA